MRGALLKAGFLLFCFLATMLMIFLSLLVVAAVLFVLAGILLALYFVLVKKPSTEQDGRWTLDRVKGKGD